jgi:hypothetical protein
MFFLKNTEGVRAMSRPKCQNKKNRNLGYQERY